MSLYKSTNKRLTLACGGTKKNGKENFFVRVRFAKGNNVVPSRPNDVIMTNRSQTVSAGTLCVDRLKTDLFGTFSFPSRRKQMPPTPPTATVAFYWSSFHTYIHDICLRK